MARRSRTRGKKSPTQQAGHSASNSSGRALSLARFSDRELKFFSLLVVMAVVWIAWGNSLHDNLTYDDVTFSPSNRSLELSLTKIGQFFTTDVWASSGKETGLYRPLFLLFMAVEVKAFDDWLVGYHVVNVLLHGLTALALFSLCQYLLLSNGGPPRLTIYAALLATLVFAVHPINTEVVNSIFNRSGILVALGMLVGLRWFLPTVEDHPLRAWLGINGIYLVILFCKETAIVFPGIIAVALYLFSSGDWQQRLRKCIPVLSMIAPMLLFLAMRSAMLNAPLEAEGIEQAASALIASPAEPVLAEPSPAEPAPIEPSPAESVPAEPLPTEAAPAERSRQRSSQHALGFTLTKFIPAAKVWFDGLVMMVWPHPLMTFHEGSRSNVWLAFATHFGLIALCLAAWRRGWPGFLFGLAIFYLVLLPSSQIFGASKQLAHLAERFFYIPSAGLAISLAFLLYWLMQRFRVKDVAIVAASCVIALTPATWARNGDWANNIKLTESDYRKGNRNEKTLRVMVSAYLTSKNLVKARQLCDRHPRRMRRDWYFGATCGQVYQSLNLMDKAETAYRYGLDKPRGSAAANYSLAMLYLRQDRRADAEYHFEQAIEVERQDFMKEILAADMLINLYPAQRSKLLEARAHLETAIKMNPQVVFAQTKLDEVNKMLGGTNR